MTHRVVIIGGGQAGAAVALKLRSEGFEGEVHLLAAEEHSPYERPPLSKAVLTDSTPSLPVVVPSGNYAERRITFRSETSAARIDREARKVVTENGVSIEYDALVIATGGQPRRLSQAVDSAQCVHYLRSYRDALALRDALAKANSLIVVGAGVIGLELASSAVKLGLRVTVIEAAARPMARCVDVATAEAIVAVHRSRGVDMRFGVALDRVEQRIDGVSVVLSTGEVAAGDLVAAGIGMDPSTGLAESCGLAVEDGIVVDELARTSDPAILAVGDVARFPAPSGRLIRLESWKHAQRHGEVAALTILGRPAPYNEVPWFWSDQHGINIQVAGDVTGGDRSVIRFYGKETATIFRLATGRIAGVCTFGRVTDMRPALMLIEKGMQVDPGDLADPAKPLRQLAQAAR